MFDVFISYSSPNTEAAQEVCSILEQQNVACWMAPRDILPGTHWAASITQAIRNARVLVLMFSASANDSAQVLREVNLAVECRVPILTIMLEQSKISDAFSYYLSVSQRFTSGGDVRANSQRLAEVVQGILRMNESSNLVPPQSESMLDIYDHEMNWAGVALRKQIHKLGLWHKTCHCWFYHVIDSVPMLYLQKRSLNKKDFPGLLDITAGRHLLKDETDREAVGKMHLELGVDVPFEDLSYLGVRTYSEHIDDFYNNEFNSVYLYNSIFNWSDFSPNPDEVSGVIRLEAEAALALFDHRLDHADAIGLFCGQERLVKKTSVRAEDFVPRADDYYQKICASIIAVASGAQKPGL